MILEDVKAYEANAKTPDSTQPIQGMWPQIPHIELSLDHDMIRGNVKGSLGKSMDKIWVFLKIRRQTGIYT